MVYGRRSDCGWIGSGLEGTFQRQIDLLYTKEMWTHAGEVRDTGAYVARGTVRDGSERCAWSHLAIFYVLLGQPRIVLLYKYAMTKAKKRVGNG